MDNFIERFEKQAEGKESPFPFGWRTP
jgi:hypothetical protein